MTDEKQRALELARVDEFAAEYASDTVCVGEVAKLAKAYLQLRADLERCRAVCEAAERLHEAWHDEALRDAIGERDEAIIECETNLSATIADMRRALDRGARGRE